jgi:hypothetical protein
VFGTSWQLSSRRRSFVGHLLLVYKNYYNVTRTHLSLNKDAPSPRAVQATGAKALIDGTIGSSVWLGGVTAGRESAPPDSSIPVLCRTRHKVDIGPCATVSTYRWPSETREGDV